MTTRIPVQHKMATGLPELLAPAGSPESFRAAVAAGADAIYLSGKRYGARKYAANFSDAEIEEAIRYAHSWGIRVYVTVNTLIHDRELNGAVEYLGWLYSIGADAVLVQDTGLLARARECIPGLPFHASTQMTIHNTPGVRWAAAQGLSRVVLARELSLGEVERIARDTCDTGVGLEVFIHGALCYSYSGQCLLSSIIGGRSGNRGSCAQPCRKPYKLVTGTRDAWGKPVNLKELPLTDHYLLSPKDLCTYYHLPELVRSPVASLKIEGRMKSPEYVAIVTSTYRRALDAIAAGSWEPSDEEYRNLLLAFNRGFTAGYLFSERYGNLMGRDAPDNRGLLVGRIEHYDPRTRKVRIRSVQPVIPATGDGILIANPNHPEREVGFALNILPERSKNGFTIPLPAPVLNGASVYITASRNLAAAARHIVAKPRPELRRPVPIDLDITISPGGETVCTGLVVRPDGVTVPVMSVPDVQMEAAQTLSLTAGQIEQQFRKTGDSPFMIRSLQIRYPEGLFAPASVLNVMRRAFLEEATTQLQASFLPDQDAVAVSLHAIRKTISGPEGRAGVQPNSGKKIKPLRLMVYTDTIENTRKAAAAGADTVCFEPDISFTGQWTCGTSSPDPVQSRILAALEACREHGRDMVWKLPRITHDGEFDSLILEIVSLHRQGLQSCMTGNPAIAQAIRNAAPDIDLYAAESYNIFNHVALRASGSHHTVCILSPELSRDDIRRIVRTAQREGTDLRCGVIVHGNIETMVTEDCLARLAAPCRCDMPGTGDLIISPTMFWLEDGDGRTYPVTMDGACRTHIGSPESICLLGQIRDLAATGITDIVIDARYRDPACTRALIRAYHEATSKISVPGDAGYHDHRSKDPEVTRCLNGSGSTGHFLKGLRE